MNNQKKMLTGSRKTDRALKKPRRVTAEWLHNAGLYYLQRFASSRSNFKRVMMRKIDRSCRAHADQDREGCVALLDAAIEKFAALGLLDDDAYTRASVTSLRARGLSSRAIQAKLESRGIDTGTIKEKLATSGSGEINHDELAAALRLCRKRRMGSFTARTANNEKSLAALARAGFSYDIAQKALQTERNEAEEILRQI